LSIETKSLGAIVLLQVAVAMIWGASWVAGRVAASEVSVLAVAGFRIIFAISMLLILVWKREGKIPPLPREARLSVLLMGIMGIFGYALCFFYGLKYIEAGQGALVVALNPVSVALCSWLFLRERLDFKKKMGILVALIGCLVVIGHGHPMHVLHGDINKGQILILGCVVCWTVYTLLGRQAGRHASSLIITFYSTVVGGGLLLLSGLIEGSMRSWPMFSWKGWLSVAFLGWLSSSLAYIWYAQGIKILGATRAAVFMNLVPLSAVCLGALLLHEIIDIKILMGGMMVMFGVWLTNQTKF
jgi:drug/metabolite transporter (DMT)-like permease